MPRALPWTTGGSASIGKTGVKKTNPKPQQRPDPASDEDLVTADLDAVRPLPAVKKPEKKRVRASSSSPPPPGPPPVESMKPGFAADDIFMMVEDEFYSTAQLYTGHIHHAEYARLKKLHKSRGRETLAGLGPGTDGKTEQSKALRMKMESLELAMKQKRTIRNLKGDASNGSDDEDSEAEDEYMQDPHLAGLMRESQMAPVQDLSGLVNIKANTRAAAGYLQSPHRSVRTRDVFAEEKVQRRAMSAVSEHGDELASCYLESRGETKRSIEQAADEDSETEDDDLDAGVPSNPESTAISEQVLAREVAPHAVAEVEVHSAGNARTSVKFVQPADEPESASPAYQRHKSRSPVQESDTNGVQKIPKATIGRESLSLPRSTSPNERSTAYKERKYFSTLARKRAERAAAEDRKTMKREDLDVIPTFLY